MIFLAPYRMPLNENGRVQPGVQIWFTETGTDVEADTYSDGTLTTVNANPYVASGTGRVDPIFLDPAVTYRIRLYSPWATPGVDTPLEEYDPYSPMVDAALLADATGADDSGSDLLGWRQGGAGAVARSVRDKLRESVSVTDFGAVGNGTTDDTAAVQAAIDSFGAGGGVVTIPKGLRVLVDTALTVKPNVSLVGPHSFVGTPQDNNSAPYGSVGGALLVNSAATITLKGGASLKGLLIHRKGMTFPASDSSAFAGTAITIGGDDAAVSNSMILGFNKGIYSTGYARGRFIELKMDNLSCIEITGCYDIPIIDSVHCWPFATIASYAVTPTASKLQRSGTAFYLHDIADWVKLSNCFAYGYSRGFDFNSVNTPSLVNCSVDGTAPPNVLAGTRGFSLRGTTADAKLANCQAASQEIGFYIDGTAGNTNHLINCIAWNGTTHGFYFGLGNATVNGGGVYSFTNGITYTNNTAVVAIGGGFTFGTGLTSKLAITVAATTDKLRLGRITDTATAAGGTIVGGAGSLLPFTIASVSPLPLPVTGENFQITGTTGIGNIQTGWAGRRITLFFSGALTVVHGTGSATAIRLSGAANFVTTAGATLTLEHNGVQWFEVGRSA